MSDDSQQLWSVDPTRTWCPTCEPHVDPLKELVIETYCHRHHIGWAGDLDNLPLFDDTADPSVEDVQRAFCKFFRSRF